MGRIISLLPRITLAVVDDFVPCSAAQGIPFRRRRKVLRSLVFSDGASSESGQNRDNSLLFPCNHAIDGLAEGAADAQ
jgi:hypothetical protein